MLKGILTFIKNAYSKLPQPPRVYYREMAPSEHRKLDFSEPPPYGFFSDTYLDEHEFPAYDWIARVPDNSFKTGGVIKNDVVLLVNRPITGYAPQLHTLVLVPPLDFPHINTGWGQLVEIEEIKEAKVVVRANEKDRQTINCSKIFAVAVGFATTRRKGVTRFEKHKCPIPEPLI